ncbi:MAG: stage 0 sporulation family protein [Chloroflexaceae bacterium]|nr:stage 0 sporulation family protein [Chloroflexaceae bacterium]
MTVVVSVRFKDSGRLYYFDPGGLDLRQGDMVIVETMHGPEIARVVYENFDIPDSDITGELKAVVRRAVAADFESAQALQTRHDEVMRICNTKIREHGLPMRLVKAEYNFDASRLTFYFTSEQRVDFRLLVRDLAHTFKTRIELRQIGPRDEARLLGGIGICGRSLCCATFLPNYARVSVKMAKDQDLPLNPSKISGVCGRLLCCLSYEHQQYLELKEGLPRRGTWVQTPDGVGEVMDINILGQLVTVQLAYSGMQEQYRVCQVQETPPPGARQARGKARGREDGRVLRENEEDEEDPDRAITHSISEVLGMLDQDMRSFEDEDDEDDNRVPDLDLDREGTFGPAPSPSGRSAPRSRRSSRERKPSAARQGSAQAQAPGKPPGEEPAPSSQKKPTRRSRRRSSDKKAKDEPSAAPASSHSPSPAHPADQPRAAVSSKPGRSRRRKRKPPGHEPNTGERE